MVGAPRTGTTLLRRLLSAHSRIAIPTESGFMADYLYATGVPLAKKKRILCREPEMGYWPITLTEAELAGCGTIAACFRYAHEKYARERGKDVWGNKTPKLVRHVRVLREAFPDARFVHVARDARAVALSLRKSRAHQLPLLYGAKRYAADAALGVAMERALGERSHRIRYEDLVTDPERELRSLADFLGVGFEPALLEGASKLPLTPGEQRHEHHTNVSKPIDASSAERWRDKLSAAEDAAILHLCGGVMRDLGYEVGEGRPASAAMEREARRAHAKVRAAKIVEELTQRPDVWQIARRRLELGSLRAMARDHVAGM